MLPAIAKVLAKIILQLIKEHLASLIDRDQAGSDSGSFCADLNP